MLLLCYYLFVINLFSLSLSPLLLNCSVTLQHEHRKLLEFNPRDIRNELCDRFRFLFYKVFFFSLSCFNPYHVPSVTVLSPYFLYCYMEQLNAVQWNFEHYVVVFFTPMRVVLKLSNVIFCCSCYVPSNSKFMASLLLMLENVKFVFYWYLLAISYIARICLYYVNKMSAITHSKTSVIARNSQISST